MRRIALLLLVLAACATTPLEQRAWIEVRSPNFTIFSNLPEDEAVALSEELELFRAVVRNLTSAKRFEPRVPTQIFAFARWREYEPFAPGPAVTGFFQRGLRRNVVAFDASGSQGVDARTVLFHEYTHFLVHNQNDLALPLWYDEGFAEFLGAVRFEDDVVFVGASPMFRKGTARSGVPHDVESIVRARGFERWNDLETSMFYLQAWQLVHYFILGPGKQEGLGKRLAHYVRLIEQGKDVEAAFEASFGMDFEALREEIGAYNRLKRIPALGVPRSFFKPDTGHQVRSVPPAEIGVHLGFLALAQHKLELAEGYFTRAIAADPARARAHAGMGDVRLLGERADEARPWYERALELAPDDYENQLEFAEWLHHGAETQQRLELVPRAREHYRRAIELAPQIPEGHAMLGRTWLLGGEDPTPGIQSLEHARKLLPSETGLLLPLAVLYENAGRHDEAVAAARRVERWSHGELREQAQKVLEQLGQSVLPPLPPLE